MTFKAAEERYLVAITESHGEVMCGSSATRRGTSTPLLMISGPIGSVVIRSSTSCLRTGEVASSPPLTPSSTLASWHQSLAPAGCRRLFMQPRYRFSREKCAMLAETVVSDV